MSPISRSSPFVSIFSTSRSQAEAHAPDIEYLKDLGVPLIGFEPDGQKYFDYHHTADDTFDKINKRELELSAGVIGSIIYLIDKHW